MKGKLTKRILAMILSVCMILTMMPSMAFAGPIGDSSDGSEVIIGAESSESQLVEPDMDASQGMVISENSTVEYAAAPTADTVGTGEATGEMTGSDFVAAAANGKITLTGNVTLTSLPTFKEDTTIDLNGHELTRQGETGNVLYLESGKLTVTGEGQIVGTKGNPAILIGVFEGESEAGTEMIFAKGSKITITQAEGATTSVIQVQSGAGLTLNGVTVKANGQGTEDKSNSAVVAIGKDTRLNIDGGSFTGESPVISIGSDDESVEPGATVATIGGDAKIESTGNTVEGENYPAVNVSAGSIVDLNKCKIIGDVAVFKNATLNINGAEITNENGFAVSTNGSADGEPNTSVGAKINFISGKLVSKDSAGVYLPAGTMTVSGGSITGKAGIVARGGDLKITGGTIEATGEDEDTVEVGDARYAVPAAAVTVDEAGYPAQKADKDQVTITGGEFKAAGDEAIAYTTKKGNDASSDEKAKAPITISGGTFTAAGEPDTTSVQSYLDSNVISNTETGTVEFDKKTAKKHVVGLTDANGNKSTVAVSKGTSDAVEVTVSGKVSTSSSDQSPSNNWWIGVGFVQPDWAQTVSYKIGRDNAFTKNNTNGSFDTWKNGEEEEKGFAFWQDAATFPEAGIDLSLKWESKNKEVIDTYHLVKGEITIQPFETEIVDFGYNDDGSKAREIAYNNRVNAGIPTDQGWKEDHDWGSAEAYVMWITFKDPIPVGITVKVPVTMPSGKIDIVECVGTNKAYTYAWSYTNTEQTGDTTVEVGTYEIRDWAITAVKTGSNEEVDNVTVNVDSETRNVGYTEVPNTSTYDVVIVGSGFNADKDAAKTAIEATYEDVTGDSPDSTHNWTGSDEDVGNGIEDAAPNTMWVTFKHSKPQTSGVDYTVNVIKDGKQVHTETAKGVKRGAVTYISLDDQLKDVEKKAGEYVFQIVRDGVAVASRTVDVYQVTYKAGEKVTGSDAPFYTDEEGLEEAMNENYIPAGFKLDSGNNRWEKTPEWVDDYSVIVTLSGYYQSSGGSSSGGGGFIPTTTPTPTPSVTPEGPAGPALSFTDSRQEKALQNRTQMDNDCTLKLAPENGEELTDVVVTSDNEDVVVVKDGKLHYVGVGSANVTVTAVGKDSGTTYTITFPVTVKEPKTPTFTPSNLSSKAKKTFTVTTSTITGADGFEIQFSLKNLAKTTKGARITDIGGGKKAIRATVSTYKSGRVYYARVRAYKMVDGKKITTAWSPIKTRKSR